MKPSQKNKRTKSCLNRSHFASFLAGELREAPPRRHCSWSSIGARDHWQRTSWSSSIARDHRSELVIIDWENENQRRRLKKKVASWWCPPEFAAHFSLLFFGGFPSPLLAHFSDNFSPHFSARFVWISGQDWLRAFATFLFRCLKKGLLSFSEFILMARCTWRRIYLPGRDRFIGLPTQKTKKQNEGWSKERFV